MNKTNNLKKMIALFLSIIMILGTSIPTFADTTLNHDATLGSIDLFNRTTDANADPSLTTLTSEDEAPEGYAWGAKFIVGVTNQTYSQGWDNLDMQKLVDWENESFPEGHPLHYTPEMAIRGRTVRIPSGDMSKKGLYVLYENVGSYKGERVNLKATLVNYEHFEKNGWTSQAIVIAHGRDEIAFSMIGMNYIEMKYEYINARTGEPISVKSFMTFDDVDHGQSILIPENQGHLFVPPNSNLRTLQQNGITTLFSSISWNFGADHESSKEDSFMTQFEGTSQTQKFCVQDYGTYDFPTETHHVYFDDYDLPFDTGAVGGGVISESYFSYSGQGLSKEKLPSITKVVSDADETLDSPTRETLTKNTLTAFSEGCKYSIFQVVPSEEQLNWYDSYILTDTLEDCLEYQSSTVYDEQGNDVSNLFTLTQDGQTITFTANDPGELDFYHHEYRFDIDVKIKTGHDMTPWLVSDSDNQKVWSIKNTASASASRSGKTETSDSNETETVITLKDVANPPKDETPTVTPSITPTVTSTITPTITSTVTPIPTEPTNIKKTATKGSSPSNTISAPKTGDKTRLFQYIAFGLWGMIGVSVMVYKKRKQR